MTALLAALCLGLLSLWTGCSDDGGEDAGCPTTRCVAGEVSCHGSAVWTCTDDGLGWDKVGCGALESCVDSACVARDCLIPGKRECEGDAGGTICAVDGMSSEPFDCADAGCMAGVCAPSSCEHGETMCGYRAVLTCKEGEWIETPCGGSKFCAEGTEGAQCEDWVCQPGTAVCDGGHTVTCDADGREATVTPCGEAEICDSGHCVAALCAEIEAGEAGPQTLSGGSTADAGSSGEDAGQAPEDAGPEEVAPHPGLEPISRIDFKLNGIPNTFDLAAMADYSEAENRMVISASDGSRKLEINLAPVDPFSVGVWSDTDDTETGVAVCYHDGTLNETPPDGAGCSVGFSHASILYTLEIGTNNGDGSRVTGTFSTSLIDSQGGQLDFTEGTFDVLHK